MAGARHQQRLVSIRQDGGEGPDSGVRIRGYSTGEHSWVGPSCPAQILSLLWDRYRFDYAVYAIMRSI
jgi:hypothetical protein